MLILSGTMKENETDSQSASLEELLIRVKDGDSDAFAEVYGKTRAAVYAMTLSYLKNAADAEDATQETFVRIWQSKADYKPQGTPMAWILTVARNLALMTLRQRARSADISEEEWHAIPADAPRVTAEDRIVLDKALGNLSDDERRVVMLHVSSGLKHREIAKLLGVPLSTVLSKYSRAIKKLQNELKGADGS